ncbi:MAG: hypothetical protein LN415_01410 [Candidatus Thermoplasmatota archaeon]|nr:hypothetical protein [Candidatus Thermoplasmatota archaeon]
MDRDAKIRLYAKVMAKAFLIASVVDAVAVGILLIVGYGTSRPELSFMLALSLLMILMGIGISGTVLYLSGGLPVLYFDTWAGGVLLVAIGHSFSLPSVLGLNWRSLVSLILSWAFLVGTIGLNYVAVRKLTRPK